MSVKTTTVPLSNVALFGLLGIAKDSDTYVQKAVVLLVAVGGVCVPLFLPIETL